MKLSNYVSTKLSDSGVRQALMAPGGAEMQLNDSIGCESRLHYVCHHHGQAAVTAAEGYARLCGAPAVVSVTAGPSSINALNGVFGAWTDSVPMLIISEQVKRETCMAACDISGLRQLGKLEAFIEARRRNFHTLYGGLKPIEEFFILSEATPGTDPSWFGSTIAVRLGAPLSRADVVCLLEGKKIATRSVLGGNLVRQHDYSEVPYRVVGDLAKTDFAMECVFWVGVYPGLTAPMIGYMLDTLREICKQNVVTTGRR